MAEVAEPMFDDEPLPADNPGKGHLKLLLLTVLALVAFLAAGLGLLAFSVQRVVTRDPQTVRQIAAEIRPVSPPPPFAPEAAFRLRMRFSQTPMLMWASFLDKATGSRLVLAAGSDPTPQDPHSRFKVLVEESLHEQGVGMPRLLAQDSRTLTISAQPPVVVIMAKTPFALSGSQRLQAVAEAPLDKIGTAALLLYVDATCYPESRLVELAESLLADKHGK